MNPKTLPLWATALAGAVLLAPGCSSSDDPTETPDDTSPEGTPEPTPDPTPTAEPTPDPDPYTSGECTQGRVIQVTTNAITTDTTWDCAVASYLVSTDLSVEGGATLTLGPGVTLQFGPDAGLFIGNQGAGALVADGSDGSIRLTSASPIGTPGDWEGVVIDALATQAELRNVTIEYAGEYTSESSTPGEAALAVYRTSATISGCTFQNNTGKGIVFDDGGHPDTFENNNFAANVGGPLKIEADQVANLSGTHNFDVSTAIEVEQGTVSTTGLRLRVAEVIQIRDGVIASISALMAPKEANPFADA